GSLFSTKGAQAATNLPRQQSAMLAVEEVNSIGGVPGATIEKSRPLVLVSCDESTNLLRAGGHLITELHVPAIVGPNTSQDTLDVNGKPISDAVNLGQNVKVSPYDPTLPDQSAIVTDYVKFQPDIVVLAGTAEAITKVMVPLEAKLPKGDAGAGSRPFYVLI